MTLTLVNRTCTSAKARAVAHQSVADYRVVTVTAKLSLKLDSRGHLTPDLDNPMAFLHEDAPTTLGVVPRDDLDRPSPDFQVVAYGHACAAEPTAALKIGLRVGQVKRELCVIGDRYWIDTARHLYSTPHPFLRMPVTYDRCFGGTQLIKTSADTAMPVSWPLNPSGKGFDALQAARPISAYLQADATYPRGEALRWLPNIEDPSHRITKSDDERLPVAWSALPTGMALHLLSNPYHDESQPIDSCANALIRAHPSWLIPAPTWPLEIGLDHFGAIGHRTWHLKPARLAVDIEQANRSQTMELMPMMLQIYADENCAALVYQTQWATKEKSAALRLREL